MPEMEIMIQGKQNLQEPLSTLPLLPRLDRLDRVLQLLEERRSLSKRLSADVNKKAVSEDEQHTRIDELEDPRKSLSCVLEEVHHKGTLMERLTMLENRVVQLSLSLDMDEGNSSGSSSSTNVPISIKLGNDSVRSTITTEGDVDKIAGTQDKEYSGGVEGGGSTEVSILTEHTNLTDQYVKKEKRSKRFKKKFGWFSMGC